MVLSKLFNDYDHWIRCVIDINHHVRNALLDILHDEINGLPRDPTELYKKLSEEYNKSGNNKFQKYFDGVKDKIEGAVLMPSCKKSNSKNWDNTLIVRMISIFRKDIKTPKGKGGWSTKTPDEDDFPLPAYVILAREIRNLFFHSTMDDFKPLCEYKSKKEDIRNILVGLGYKNMLEFDEDDCLYTVGLANIRKLMEIGSNANYSCESCGLQLNESKFKEVVDEMIDNLKERDRKCYQMFFERFSFVPW